MPLTYRHFYLTVADLIDQTVALMSGMTVDPVLRSATSFQAGFTGADGQAATVRIDGAGFGFRDASVSRGRIDAIDFLDGSGAVIGRLEGLELGVFKMNRLLQTEDGVARWLMAQDWNTHFSHAFQPVSNLPAGSLLDSGQRFELVGDDYISLSFSADRFDSGRGHDILYGRYGDDALFGGKGNDTIKGNHNDDRLSGGFGNDHLYGGSGKDRMTGGLGADTFIWEVDFGDTGLGLGGGRDTITDYDPEHDTLRLEMATVGVTGPDRVRFLDHAEGVLVRIRYSTAGEQLKQDILLIGVEPGAMGFQEIVFT